MLSFFFFIDALQVEASDHGACNGLAFQQPDVEVALAGLASELTEAADGGELGQQGGGAGTAVGAGGQKGRGRGIGGGQQKGDDGDGGKRRKGGDEDGAATGAEDDNEPAEGKGRLAGR